MDQPTAMPHPSVPDAVQAALREMHPDPFTQAAIERLYQNAPGLLDAKPYVTLAYAHGMTAQEIFDARETQP